MKYLLDTNCIAAAIKGRLPMAIKLAALRPGDIAVSAIGRMEAESGLRASPHAAARYTKLLREFFSAVRMLDFGAVEVQQAVTLDGYLKQSGEQLAGYDLLVAATALANQLTLVTDRPAAYASVPGLEIENWLGVKA